jgi:hypothetical protein
MFYFICVRELTAKGCSVLDEKSKQFFQATALLLKRYLQIKKDLPGCG